MLERDGRQAVADCNIALPLSDMAYRSLLPDRRCRPRPRRTVVEVRRSVGESRETAAVSRWGRERTPSRSPPGNSRGNAATCSFERALMGPL